MKDLLLEVERPGRYIGSEFNSLSKNDLKKGLKFAICFPNTYEIGMSNLGLRIIYGLLNSQSDIRCERFFLPAPDMLGFIKSAKHTRHTKYTSAAKLSSLESGRSLSEFDIVGFSLQYELDYTNVLHMLDISNLPFLSKERNQAHPLIIAGGPALGNPEPIAEFFDIILIGEAEEALLELIAEFRKWTHTLDRSSLLEKLAKIEGVYVPGLYEPSYRRNRSFKDLRVRSDRMPSSVKRRFVKDLDAVFFPTSWITPYISIVHDKILVELMRGCPHSCYFCQARVFYFPFRIRSKEKVLQLAYEAQEASGYEALGLLGLSVSDHPQIKDILNSLIEIFRSQCVAVSLGSLRPTSIISELLEQIVQIKKGGLTLAIESGSAWLRKLINKQVDLEATKNLIAKASDLGFRKIKLYFMYGLPFEEEKDLEAIADTIYELSQIRGKGGRRLFFTISINPFVPKAHTVFQWHPMDDLETLEKKRRFLKSAVFKRLKTVKLDFRSAESSFIEAIFSRGDRRLSKVIIEAFRKGAILDSYGDYFKFSLWQEALETTGLDVNHYVYRNISLDEKLAWDHIDINYSKEKLKSEYEKVCQFAGDRQP